MVLELLPILFFDGLKIASSLHKATDPAGDEGPAAPVGADASISSEAAEGGEEEEQLKRESYRGYRRYLFLPRLSCPVMSNSATSTSGSTPFTKHVSHVDSFGCSVVSSNSVVAAFASPGISIEMAVCFEGEGGTLQSIQEQERKR